MTAMPTEPDYGNIGVMYLDYMQRLYKDLVQQIKELKFEKKHPWHLTLMLLYGRHLEALDSASTLIQAGRTFGVQSLLRGAVEANLDFVLLVQDKKYGYNLKAAQNSELIKLMREASAGTNPFLPTVTQFPKLNQELAKLEAEQKHLKAQGFIPLTVKQKFEKAKFDKEHRSIYVLLCCDSHNNMVALVDRHLNIAKDAQDFQVEYFKPVNLNRLLPYMDNLCGLVLTASVTIHKTLKSNVIDEVERAQTELKSLRNSLQAIAPKS